MGGDWKSFEVHVGGKLDCLKEIFARNMDTEGAGEVSDGNEGKFLVTGRKLTAVIKWQSI